MHCRFIALYAWFIHRSPMRCYKQRYITVECKAFTTYVTIFISRRYVDQMVFEICGLFIDCFSTRVCVSVSPFLFFPFAHTHLPHLPACFPFCYYARTLVSCLLAGVSCLILIFFSTFQNIHIRYSNWHPYFDIREIARIVNHN